MNAIIGRTFVSKVSLLSRRAILPLTILLTGAVMSWGGDATATRFFAKPSTAKVRLEGTSSVHDWQMEGPMIGGFLEAGPDFPTKPGVEMKPGKVSAKVEAFISVRSLKSIEKDGKPYKDSMDAIVWEKLLQEKYPKISYHGTEMVLKESPKTKDGAFVFDTTGELAIAGVTNKVSMPVNITPLDDGKALHIIGNTKVKMTDFKIEPPSPKGLGLFIKTGDDVKVIFDWTVEQKAAPAPPTASKP